MIRAPRRSAVGSRSAWPVAIAKRNTAPIVLRARVADLPQRVKDFRRFDFRDRSLAELFVSEIKQLLLLLQRFPSLSFARANRMNEFRQSPSCYALGLHAGSSYSPRRRFWIRGGAVSIRFVGLAPGSGAPVPRCSRHGSRPRCASTERHATRPPFSIFHDHPSWEPAGSRSFWSRTRRQPSP